MKKFFLCLALALPTIATAQRVDLNMTGRPEREVNAEGFTPWAVADRGDATLQIDQLKLTLKGTAGNQSTGLRATWWKQGVRTGMPLIGDGIVPLEASSTNKDAKPQGKRRQVKENQGTKSITLTLDGLTAGHHTLLAYHNIVDGYNLPAAPIDVWVNGQKVLSNVRQSVRANDLEASGRSYIGFEAQSGQPVNITYSMAATKEGDVQPAGLCINALVIDEANPDDMASHPYPDNGELHADADHGMLLLSWKGAAKATKHHLYLGTSPNDMKEVSQTNDTYYRLDKPSNLNTYYWRVDEEDSQGAVTRGTTWNFRTRHLAFPGAEGYGKYATGGRGGSVYHVTSLDDDPKNPQPGTLRHALTRAKGPRTIVFDVAGTITLKARLTCSEPFVTIAGQTAPGRGIMLRGCPMGMASEGITRFMRIRLGHKKLVNGVIPGERNGQSYGAEAGSSMETTLGGMDGMGMAGNDNSIMDHCSISWTIDEAFSSRNAQSLTLQHTLISEALNVAGHPNYPAGKAHGFAGTIGGGENTSQLKVGSYHHNLLAHCEGRNWSISGGLTGDGTYDGHHDIFNNVVYNWGGRATDGGSHEINFVNNYYKMGPATQQKYTFRLQLEGTGKGQQSAYVNGNIRQEAGNGALTEDALGVTYRYELSHNQKLSWQPFVSVPFFPSLANVESARNAYKNVLSDVGCNEPGLDNHDERMIRETLTGTTSTKGSRSGKPGLIDSEEDAGCEGYDGLNIVEARHPEGFDSDGDGMPDWWEKAKGLNANEPDNNGDPDGDGYTNLEDYLNWMGSPHIMMNGDKKMAIDMKKYFAGYNNEPRFTVEGASNLQLKPGKNGLYTLQTRNFKGFTTLTVTATDADNWGSMTRTIGVYVE